jgi:CubicO group peptidase (beta-lactamase class C family)
MALFPGALRPAVFTSRFVRAFKSLLSIALWLSGLALALGASCLAARAQDSAVAAALDATIQDWMRKYHVPAAALAAMKDGQLVKPFSYGGMDAAKPARIASLSKAITAVCVARLIDQGLLAFNEPLGSAIPDAFRRYGEPADPRFKTITIEQLLTHRAGLAREARARRNQDLAGTFRSALAIPLEGNPGGPMSYSNIGYITLGIVAETLTGQDYERYCRGAALAPLGASGSIDPVLRYRTSNGGWRVSAIDYAKFIQVFDPSAHVLGQVTRGWQDALFGDEVYGLGTFIRRTPRGPVFYHSGRAAPDQYGDRSGAYTMKFPNGWTTVITFEGDPRGSDLRRRLEGAVANR